MNMNMKKGLILWILVVSLGCIGQPEITEEKIEPTETLLTVGEEAYYAHYIRGHLLGYTHYTVTDTQEYQNETVSVVEAETLLSLTMAGAPYTMSYETTEYYTQSLYPRYYKAAITLGEEDSDIECTFEKGKVSGKIQSPDLTEEKELSIHEDAYLLDSNTFHHWVFIFRTLEPQSGAEAAVSLFMPQAMQEIDITITFLREDDTLGQTTIYAETTIFDQVHKFWVTPQGELLALEIPSQSFRMEPSDATVTERVESYEFIELLSAPSNVSFDDPLLVDYLQVRLTADIVAEVVDEDFLSSKYQQFSGTTTENRIEGVFEVRTEKFTGPGDVYPLAEPQQYLLPAESIESDNPVIKEKAEEITEGCTESWEASQKIAQWVYENITYKITGEGALKTLETLEGDCGPHAYLTVAMLRSLGIPARIVGGIVYGRIGGEPLFVQHYWTEVYIGGEWIPFDSTVGQDGYIDATHVRLVGLGGVKIVEIEVLDYTQAKPEIRVEEKEALLNIGEYYKYRFVINDVEFGYTDYRIKKKELYEGQEAFYVELHLDLDFQKIDVERTATLDAQLYITEDVKPLSYQVEALVNDEKQTIECTFSEGKAHDVVTVGDETYEEEITLEENTYLMENNMIGLWALVYRTLQLEVGQTYKVPLFFSGNFLKLVVDIEVERIETIVVSGTTYEVYVCNVPLFKEIDYVTKDGLLVKVEAPSQNLFIELTESSASFYAV